MNDPSTKGGAMAHQLESTQAGGLILRCGRCGTVFDATRAKIVEMAVVLGAHLEHSHGLEPAAVDRELFDVATLRT